MKCSVASINVWSVPLVTILFMREKMIMRLTFKFTRTHTGEVCIHEVSLCNRYYLLANKMRNVSVHAIKFHLNAMIECQRAVGKNNLIDFWFVLSRVIFYSFVCAINHRISMQRHFHCSVKVFSIAVQSFIAQSCCLRCCDSK